MPRTIRSAGLASPESTGTTTIWDAAPAAAVTRTRPGLRGGIREEAATTNRNLRRGRRQCHDEASSPCLFFCVRESGAECHKATKHIAPESSCLRRGCVMMHHGDLRLAGRQPSSPKHTQTGFSVLTDRPAPIDIGPKKERNVSSCGHQGNHRSGMQLAARAGMVGRLRLRTAHDSSQRREQREQREQKVRIRHCDDDAVVVAVKGSGPHRAPHRPA